MAATVVASTTLINSSTDASGSPGQSHLIYAENHGRWWYFFTTGPGVSQTGISCRVSSSNDLSTATWSDPTGNNSPSVASGNTAANQRNWAVGYANIASTDVVHIRSWNIGNNNFDHIRATITAATTISWGSWVMGAATGGASLGSFVTGPVLGIYPNAGTYYVYSNEWEKSEGAAGRSTNAEAGTSWTAGWNTTVLWDNTATLDSTTAQSNVFALADLGGGVALALGENSGTEPNMTNVDWAKSDSSGVWTAASKAAIFTDTSTQNQNDWGAVGRTTSDVHAIKRKTSTTFEHQRFNGTSWSAGDTIPSTGLTAQLAASGIFMATDGTSVWAFVIDTNANKDVKYVKWVSGTGWDSSWSTLSSTNTNTKAFLSGYQKAENSQINVVWTENASSPFQVDVASLSLVVAAQIPYNPWQQRAPILAM